LKIVDFLSTSDVDLGAKDNQGMTALHWAAWYCHLDVIDLLLQRGAPLEVENDYGGTVLGSTVYASVNSGLELDYAPVIDLLLTSGANIKDVGYPSGNRRVDGVLERHGGKQ
jgi:ankyrin repeat protein